MIFCSFSFSGHTSSLAKTAKEILIPREKLKAIFRHMVSQMFLEIVVNTTDRGDHANIAIELLVLHILFRRVLLIEDI